MFERFTDRGRRVVVLAQEEARMLNHNYIGTEHILLGLVHEGEGVAALALESLDISIEAVRQQVGEIIGQGQAAPTGHIPFTPRAKKVLELSLREALQLGAQLHRDRAHPAGPDPRGRGCRRPGAAEARRRPQPGPSDRDPAPVRVPIAASEEMPTTGGTPASGTKGWTPASGPSCPWCSKPLEGALAYRNMVAAPDDDEGDPISLFLLYCKSCGGIVRTSLD